MKELFEFILGSWYDTATSDRYVFFPNIEGQYRVSIILKSFFTSVTIDCNFFEKDELYLVSMDSIEHEIYIFKDPEDTRVIKMANNKALVLRRQANIPS